jgi:pimeloyl-ACP methyl ester carboxylesterase
MAARWWLLPGTLCTPEVFRPILDILKVPSQDCRPVRLDRPSVEDYAEDLAAVEPQDVVLGFSLGAILAAHHVDRIPARAVVLLAANPFADMPGKRAARLDQLAAVSSRGARPVMSALWPAMVGPAASSNPAIGERIVAMAEATAADLPAQTELALTRPGAEPMLAAARAPVLFVTGREDQAAPPERAERAARIGAHALTLIEGAGHFLPLEAPQACADAIAGFLKEKEASPC